VFFRQTPGIIEGVIGDGGVGSGLDAIHEAPAVESVFDDFSRGIRCLAHPLGGVVEIRHGART